MPTLLQIDSSPMGEASISRRLTKEFVRGWRLANPQGRVMSRDLTTIAIPVIDAAWVAANWTPKESRTQQQNELLTFSTELTTELLDADEYVIGVPMHNWGPSASFKLWVDHILRVGETIMITPFGIKGTLDKKRITFCIAAGGHYGPGSADAQKLSRTVAAHFLWLSWSKEYAIRHRRRGCGCNLRKDRPSSLPCTPYQDNSGALFRSFVFINRTERRRPICSSVVA